MKNVVLFISLIAGLSAFSAYAQQDTITAFDFADSTDYDLLADFGLIGNLAYGLDAEDTNGNQRSVYYTNGASNFSATAVGWDGGLQSKYWLIKFNADGYSGFKVSSKQSAGGSNPGPKYWKLQCRLEGGLWEDISPDTIVVANNWTTGVVTEWALPGTMDNPGATAIYIRWIMASNQSISGPNVLSNGIAKIDDITVTGLSSVGVATVIYTADLHCFPNPAGELLNITSPDRMSTIEVYDLCGSKRMDERIDACSAKLNLSELAAGYYFVKVYFAGTSAPISKKLIVK